MLERRQDPDGVPIGSGCDRLEAREISWWFDALQRGKRGVGSREVRRVPWGPMDSKIDQGGILSLGWEVKTDYMCPRSVLGDGFDYYAISIHDRHTSVDRFRDELDIVDVEMLGQEKKEVKI